MSVSLQPHGLHTRLPCLPRVCSSSCPWSQWFHPTISSSVFPFSSCLQSFPASGSFPMSQLFESGGQSITTSASVLPIIIQGLSPLELTGWPCCPKDSEESSPEPQFKSISSSVLSLPHGPTLTSVREHWKNHGFDCMDLCWQSDVSAF